MSYQTIAFTSSDKFKIKRFPRDKNNYTLLHVAAEAGSLSNVKLLVLDDEDLMRAEDNEGRTALHIACTRGYQNIVSFLLTNGADPLVKTQGGLNCLEAAVQNKQDEIVEELLLSDHWKNVSTLPLSSSSLSSSS